MRQIVLIVHNVRSCHNVGSLLRTAEGLGLDSVYLTGYTPYPASSDDSRLPHIRAKIDRQIHKTALGAEALVKWRHQPEIKAVISDLKRAGFCVAGLEQSKAATQLPGYQPPDKLAVVAGREVEGLEPEVMALCDVVLEIPMFGRKESFNVAVAAAMALYHSRFQP